MNVFTMNEIFAGQTSEASEILKKRTILASMDRGSRDSSIYGDDLR